METNSLVVAVKTEIERASGLPVEKMRSMNDTVKASFAQRTFDTFLLASFGGISLLLAAIGIYGSISFSAQQRAKEIGIRLALGADHKNIKLWVIPAGCCWPPSESFSGCSVGIL